MTYALISAAFLGLAAVGAAALSARGRRAGSADGSRPPGAAPVLATLVVLVVLTAVFDSIMISAGLVGYEESAILGVRIWNAPLEDFSYPVAGAVLLPALWRALRRTPGERRLRDVVARLTAASRPVSWINTAFPFGAAYLMTTRDVDWILIAGFVYFLIPYNLAMYGINDVFDYRSDLANPRKGGIEGALLPPDLHRVTLGTVVATNAPFAVLLGALGDLQARSWLAFSLFAVAAYSVPGLRLKERPFLDSATSAAHFVTPAVFGLALAGAEFDGGLVLVLVAFTLWAMAAHAFGAVQDIGPDRSAGIASVATVIGARATVRLALGLWTAAGLAMLLTPWPGPIGALLAVPYLVNCAPFRNLPDERAGETNPAWRRFIALNYLAGFLATMLLIVAWRGS